MTIQNKSTGYLYLAFSICFLSGVFGGLTSTLVPTYLPAITKELATDNNETIGAIINCTFIFGMLIGGLTIGAIADKIGRKKALVSTILCIGIFTFLSAFNTSFEWLIYFRSFTGFGVGGTLMVTSVFISEIWIPEKKNIALGILSISFPVGIFSAGLITYNIANWHSAFYVGALPIIMGIASLCIVQESEEWLTKSIPQTKTIHQKNNPLVFSNIVYGSILYGTMLIGLWAVFAWLPTWVQSLVSENNKQAVGGLSMMIFASGGLLGGVVSGWLSNRFGINTIMHYCFAVCFIISIALFKFTNEITTVTYIEMALLALGFGISQGVLNSYIPALFPTEWRSRGTGICFNISRLFTAIAVFFIGAFVNFFGGYGNTIFYFSFIFLLGFLIHIFIVKKQNARIY